MSESITELLESEKIAWTQLRSIALVSRIYLSTDSLTNIKFYYGLFVVTLDKLVSIKSQLEQNISQVTDEISQLDVITKLLAFQCKQIHNKPHLLLQKINIYLNKMIRYGAKIN